MTITVDYILEGLNDTYLAPRSLKVKRNCARLIVETVKMMETGGTHNFVLRNAMDAIGMNKSMFYNYFDNILELFKTIIKCIPPEDQLTEAQRRVVAELILATESPAL